MERNLYIVAGCNGAGKTTASYTVLPEILHCHEFVNADEIAHGLSPFNPAKVTVEAGRLMIHRIDDLLAHNESFAVETTLSPRSYIGIIRRAHAQDYIVSLLFFWLNSVRLAEQRVAERVRKGGHDISPEVIKRRYMAGIRNLMELYANEVDYWAIFDNSTSPRQMVATGGREAVTRVLQPELYNRIQEICQNKN